MRAQDVAASPNFTNSKGFQPLLAADGSMVRRSLSIPFYLNLFVFLPLFLS